MAADDDNVARAYARLVGLKESLPGGTSIPERYVEEYHQALSLEGRDKRLYASGTTGLPGYTEFLQEASVPVLSKPFHVGMLLRFVEQCLPVLS